VTIAEYLEEVKERLLTDPRVLGLHIVRERVTTTDCHLRARLVLLDGSQLEFSEYVQRQSDGSVGVVTYSYNWTSASQELVRRWDNTPYYPQLAGSPHHIHDGATNRVSPGQTVTVLEALGIIAREAPATS